MSQYWESLSARSDGQHTSDELEAAAYRLVAEQVLYYADRHSRTAYWMVERYEREFRQALAPLGVDIQVNRQLRYAYALPKHAKAGTASIAQTVFALVLRALYDESARTGQMNDEGEVICDLVELDEKYRLLSGKELPAKGRLDALMETMKRWGIARKSDEHQSADADGSAADQPYAVVIRPAIADVLGEAALARLAQFHAAGPAADAEGNGETSVQDEDDMEALPR
jgi:hypothetical protein